MLPDNELQRKSIDTIKHCIRDQLGGYKIATKNIPAHEVLFRGVRLKDGDARPNIISRISYPPLDKAKELIQEDGRLNRAGQSIFYCSKAAPAVFYELQAKPGEFFVLSAWETTESLWMCDLGYHSQVLKQIGAQDYNISARQQLINPIPNETKKNKKIRYRLSKAFAIDAPKDKKYRYKQSIAIAELFLDGSPIPSQPGGPKIDKAAGIVYPAMKLCGDADNIVFLPEIVESSLKIKSALYVKIEAADEKLFSYTILTEAIAYTFLDGNIVWRDTQEQEIEADRRCSITLENASWVQRDGYGRVYGSH